MATVPSATIRNDAMIDTSDFELIEDVSMARISDGHVGGCSPKSCQTQLHGVHIDAIVLQNNELIQLTRRCNRDMAAVALGLRFAAVGAIIVTLAACVMLSVFVYRLHDGKELPMVRATLQDCTKEREDLVSMSGIIGSLNRTIVDLESELGDRDGYVHELSMRLARMDDKLSSRELAWYNSAKHFKSQVVAELAERAQHADERDKAARHHHQMARKMLHDADFYKWKHEMASKELLGALKRIGLKDAEIDSLKQELEARMRDDKPISTSSCALLAVFGLNGFSSCSKPL
eukprot:TRINITY_DN17311_c0_g1_i1.p1 TRINITY_DN17311_c0_g1~~TRINITY_DN17311_c0_g1_i1.p1  ORF type:complete len:309 (-),score=68.33 TRINITY_DN17311_c0_g1_i1:334-1203(-)